MKKVSFFSFLLANALWVNAIMAHNTVVCYMSQWGVSL